MIDIYEMRITFRGRAQRGQVVWHFTLESTEPPDPILDAGTLWFAYIQFMWADILETQGSFVGHRFVRIRRVNNGGGPWYRINPLLILNPLNPPPLWFETAAVVTMHGRLNGRWVGIPWRLPGVWMDGQANNQLPALQRARLILATSKLFIPWTFLGRTYRFHLHSRKTGAVALPLAADVRQYITGTRRRRRKGSV